MMPSKPGTAQELKDFDQVKNKDAVAMCYALELVSVEGRGEDFFLNPAAPMSPEALKAMANKAAKLAGMTTGFAPAGPTADDACQQLLDALLQGAEGLPTLKIISETTTMDTLTIAEGELYRAPAGKELTMTVSGVGTNMKPGTYENVTLTVTESHLKSTGGPGGEHTHHFRTALFVKDGKIVEEKSVRAAVLAGEVSGEKATDLRIDDRQHLFNGLMIMNGKYAIENAISASWATAATISRATAQAL